jgi:hypothetical protein
MRLGRLLDRHAGWLGWLLLTLALLRAGSLVFAEPFTAYANQYDMTRSSACLGLWPQTADGSLRESRVPEPQADYRYDGLRNEACYPSTVVGLAGIALGLDAAVEWLRGTPTRDFDLRQIGALQLALLFALAALLHRQLGTHPRLALAHAGLLLVVLADPINSLYANTFYTEFAALLGAYAALGALLLMSLRERVGWPLALLFALGLAALGLSRVQHLLLPIALVVCALLGVRGRASLPQRAVWATLALLIPLAQLQLQGSAGAVDQANRTNTILGGVLSSSSDPDTTAARLGLSTRCAELSHTNWYQRRGLDPIAECPQLMQVSRARLLWVLATEPRTSLVLLANGLALGSDWRMAYVGERSGGDWLRVSGPEGAHPTLAQWIAPRGPTFLLLLWLLPLLFSVAALWRLLSGRAQALDALQVGTAGLVSIGLVTTFAGDGLIETARHLHLAANALLLLWLLVLARAEWLQQDAQWPLGSLRLSSGAWLLLYAASTSLLPRLPLAFGSLDTPAHERFSAAPDGVQVAGWALEAHGLERVHARLADGRVIRAEIRPDAFLSRMFPVGGGLSVARFELRLPADSPPGWVEFEAVSTDGEVGRFERRLLVAATD